MRAASARLARIAPPGINGSRVHIDTESEFLSTDPAAWYMVILNNGRQGDRIRVEWRNPAGAVVQQSDHVQTAETGPIRFVWRLLISGNPAALAPGDWQVRVFANDRRIASADFRISNPPDTIVNIASKTLLPEATAAVPYFYQMTARGGAPPYKWTATQAFPAGLSLSVDGVVSGTPQERGSYRATVEVKDAHGNSVARNVAIPIGILSPSARSATHILLKMPPRDGCAPTTSQSEFSPADANVVLAASLEAPGGREGRVEWLNPRGEVYQMNHISKASERKECIVETMPLAGRHASNEPGEWRVRLMWSDLEVFTLKFNVAAVKSGGAPAATAARGPEKNASPARSGRVAILIGNLRYEKLPAAGSAAADLDVLERALRQDGFEVVRKADANLDNLRLIEHTLDDSLQAGDTALIYYAGYDVREGGDDWLVPVNFDPGDARPIQSKAYSTVRLMQFLEDSKASLRFLFLDAAAAPGQPRENPGAVMGEVDDATAVVYSAPPGAAKAAGPAPGTFARALAEVLGKPGLDARTALQVELPKALGRIAPSSSSPIAILGGGADFVFRAAGGQQK